MALHERWADATVAAAVVHRSTQDPASPLIFHGGRGYGAAALDNDAEALAAALRNLGVEAGDRVALLLPPCPEFVIALFACARLGAVVVPLSPGLTVAELQYQLRHSEAVCAVTIEQAGEVDYLQVFEELMAVLPELQYLVTVGEEDLWYDDRIFQFEDLVSAGAGRDYTPSDAAPDDLFAILYTSGTTGKPKGVELSHRGLLATAAGTAERLELGSGDVVAGVSALYHVFGLTAGLLAALVSGASLVLQDGGDADTTLGLVVRHGATVLCGVPTQFVAALRSLRSRKRDLSSLRLAVMAGAPVRQELARSVEEAVCPVVVAYSLTEASSVVAAGSPADDPARRWDTVGRPLPGTEVVIRDVDGSALPVESVGEIFVRGPGVMAGYHRQPGATAAARDGEGFLHTGDLGMLDEAGYLHLVGRSKDVIIRSGFNVYPREVEFRVESHPAVHEAAVVGVPDPLLGEAICACVVPDEGAIVTEREIVDWCGETLAAGKVPDLVRFVDALPRTDTGKVRRRELVRLIQSGAPPA